MVENKKKEYYLAWYDEDKNIQTIQKVTQYKGGDVLMQRVYWNDNTNKPNVYYNILDETRAKKYIVLGEIKK